MNYKTFNLTYLKITLINALCIIIENFDSIRQYRMMNVQFDSWTMINELLIY